MRRALGLGALVGCAMAGLALSGGVSRSAPAAEVAAPPPSDVYDRNCSVCHQAGAVGMAGAYPKLAGTGGALAAIPAGRKLMISAVLYGMAGKLTSGEDTIMGVMTAFPQLSDAEVAEALTFVSHLEGKAPAPFSAAEVAKLRAGPPMTPNEVNALARDPTVAKAIP